MLMFVCPEWVMINPEGALRRRGASGTVLLEARGFRAGGFAGPSESHFVESPCRKLEGLQLGFCSARF
jgi:hypothetical protein